MLSRQAFALYFSFQVAAGRLLLSLPEDTYAFPKYRVTYLNGLPVLRDTAERWLQEGIRGGELEFLGQPWKEGTTHASPSRKGIGSGDSQETGEVSYTKLSLSTVQILMSIYEQPVNFKMSNVTLEHMKMGPNESYLCLIPPSPDSPTPQVEDPEEDLTPIQSWSLLQPLAGKCLYVS